MKNSIDTLKNFKKKLKSIIKNFDVQNNIFQKTMKFKNK